MNCYVVHILESLSLNTMKVVMKQYSQGESDCDLSLCQAVQYVQENPDEVCPAGWKPGEKTMKPDSKLSKEYFSAI